MPTTTEEALHISSSATDSSMLTSYLESMFSSKRIGRSLANTMKQVDVTKLSTARLKTLRLKTFILMLGNESESRKVTSIHRFKAVSCGKLPV